MWHIKNSIPMTVIRKFSVILTSQLHPFSPLKVISVIVEFQTDLILHVEKLERQHMKSIKELQPYCLCIDANGI